MSTRPLQAGEEDAGAWEQQSTRKQRKKQAKQVGADDSGDAAAAAGSSSAAAAADGAAAAADSSVQAAQGSSFPIDAAGGTGDADDAAMFGDFMQAGFIGLDGQQIPAGATLIQPPAPTPAPAASSSSSSSTAAAATTPATGGAPGRRPRYNFDANQLPTCFLCQTRHDIGQCRKKEKL